MDKAEAEDLSLEIAGDLNNKMRFHDHNGDRANKDYMIGIQILVEKVLLRHKKPPENTE